MKKIVPVLILLICVAAAGIFIASTLSKNFEGPLLSGGADGELEQGRKKVPAAQPAVPRAKKEKGQEVKKPASPLKIRFGVEESPASDGIHAFLLLVDANREAWPSSIQPDVQMELLLRLPASIRLKSEGWESKEIPAKEQNDPTGSWQLFVRTIPLSLGPVPPQTLVQAPVILDVLEEGTNWVITVRARLISGEEAWQSFGVIFATRKGEQIQFHHAPRTDYLTR